jgi:hypothetical protein
MPKCGRKDYVNDTIGNRTRELPACSTVPQPTAPPRIPRHMVIYLKYLKECITRLWPQIGPKSIIKYEA